VLPVVEAGAAAAQLRRLDGLVLSGGQDLDAELRGRARHPASTWLDPDRDRHEGALLRRAVDRGLPVLGICRGMQLVADALGGALCHHLDGHDSGSGDAAAGHTVAVAPGSALAAAVGAESIRVNTIHHQAVERLPDGLRVVARAGDGTLEAAEGRAGGSWFLGVQWHPELMLGMPGGQDVFDALVAACASTGGAER
jgi:putative glutamine amidotransferase